MSGVHWLEEVLSELEQFSREEKYNKTSELLADARLIFLNEVRERKEQDDDPPSSFSYNSGDFL